MLIVPIIFTIFLKSEMCSVYLNTVLTFFSQIYIMFRFVPRTVSFNKQWNSRRYLTKLMNGVVVC